MSKKLALLFCVIWSGYTPLKGHLSDGEKILSAVAVGAIVLVVGIKGEYSNYKELIEIRTQSAQPLIKTFNDQFRPVLNDIKSLRALQNVLRNTDHNNFHSFKSQVQQSHRNLTDSYFSFFSSFNDIEKLGQTYRAIQQAYEANNVIGIMQKYQIFILADSTVSVLELVQQYRQGDSETPLHTTAAELNRDIAAIRAVRHERFHGYSILTAHLNDLLHNIQKTGQYAEETKRIADIQRQEKLLRAQEERNAVEAQKAKALDERNAIEAEKLKTQREELARQQAERAKQQQEAETARRQRSGAGIQPPAQQPGVHPQYECRGNGINLF